MPASVSRFASTWGAGISPWVPASGNDEVQCTVPLAFRRASAMSFASELVTSSGS
jgi:hypothetical protein